jgi:hypothetical protein
VSLSCVMGKSLAVRVLTSLFLPFSLAGKTTFLNDATRLEKSVYIRQHHSLRPDITVSRIPNFDPSKLPFWNIYESNGTALTVKVGGFMSGRYTGKHEMQSNSSRYCLFAEQAPSHCEQRASLGTSESCYCLSSCISRLPAKVTCSLS